MVVEEDDTVRAYATVGREKVGYKCPPKSKQWVPGQSGGGHLHKKKRKPVTLAEILRGKWNKKIASGATLGDGVIAQLLRDALSGTSIARERALNRIAELCPELFKPGAEPPSAPVIRMTFVETPKPGKGSILPDISHLKEGAEIIDWDEYHRRHPNSTAKRNPKIDEEE